MWKTGLVQTKFDVEMTGSEVNLGMGTLVLKNFISPSKWEITSALDFLIKLVIHLAQLA